MRLPAFVHDHPWKFEPIVYPPPFGNVGHSANGAVLQAFTAIGRVGAGSVYQADAGADFRPFRVAVDYLPGTPAPIRPLIDALTFIRSKTHWGAAFRFGIVRVPAEDFARIAAAMGRDFAADFTP